MNKGAGKSIKNIVKIVVGVQYAVYILIGFMTMVFISATNYGADFEGFLVGALIAGVGCFFARLSGLVMYAFGEITDRLVSIDEKLGVENAILNEAVSTAKSNTTAADQEGKWVCYCCHTINSVNHEYCIHCKSSKGWSDQMHAKN